MKHFPTHFHLFLTTPAQRGRQCLLLIYKGEGETEAVKGGTILSCQGHTARSVAEEGVVSGTFRLQIQGTIPSLTQLPSPLNSKPAGGLGGFLPRPVALAGLPLFSWKVPRLCPPPTPHPTAHYQMGGAGTLGLVEFPTRQEKEQRNCMGGEGGGGWPGGWQEWRGHFTMEYEVKKGKKVGGRLEGVRGREMSPESEKWEAWGEEGGDGQ